MNKGNIFVRISKIRHIEYILLSLILIIGLLLRLYKIENPIADWHSWRQADTASVSKEYAKGGINLLYPRYHDISTTQTRLFNPQGYRFVEFPIYNAIHASLANNFQLISFDIWGRLLSVLASLISVFLIFFIGKRFIGIWGGVLASAFLALLPYNIYFSRVVLPEPFATALALISLWFFIQFYDTDKIHQLYFSAAFFALALLVKPFVIFYALPIAYLAVKKYGLKEIFKNLHLGLSFILAVIPILLWRFWMSQFPQGIPLWKWAFNGDGIRFKPSFWRWIFGERLGLLILGGWGLIPFVFGILKPKIKNYFTHVFALGMLLYVVIVASANVKHDYYQIITIPAISLLLAQGSLYLWQTKNYKSQLSRGILLFSVMVMFFTGLLKVREFYKINRPEIIKAGEEIQRLTPEDALIVAPYNGDTAFLYQTERWGWPVVDRPIDELIEKGADYFVSVDLNHPQTIEFSERFEVIKKTKDYIIIKLE